MPREISTNNPNSVWDFMSEVERAFEGIWRVPVTTGSLSRDGFSVFTPAVDVRETEEAYLLSMDVPGIPMSEISINTQNGRITVRGERAHEERKDDKMFRRVERTHGRFERSFQLPQDIIENKIQARYENGVLEIMIPKAEVAKPRSIRIDTEKGGLFSRLLGQKNVEANSKRQEDSEKQKSDMSSKH